MVCAPIQRVSLERSLSDVIGQHQVLDQDLGIVDMKELQSAFSEDKKGFLPYHATSVPRTKNLQACANENVLKGMPITTLMLRNIPNKYSQNSLMQEINDLDFSGTYDFFYLPMDIHNRSNVGYAFINFLCSVEAQQFRGKFQGHAFLRFHSRKVGDVCDAHLQGLDANILHFEHRDVSLARNDQYRPAVIVNKKRIKFEDAVRQVHSKMASTCYSLPSPTCSTVSSRSMSLEGRRPESTAESQETCIVSTPRPLLIEAPPRQPPTQKGPYDEKEHLESSAFGFTRARLGLEAAIRDMLCSQTTEPNHVFEEHSTNAPVSITKPSYGSHLIVDRECSQVPVPKMSSPIVADHSSACDVLQLLALRNRLVQRLLECQTRQPMPLNTSWNNSKACSL